MWVKIQFNPMRYRQLQTAFTGKAQLTRGGVNRDGTCRVFLDTMLERSEARQILAQNNIKFISLHGND